MSTEKVALLFLGVNRRRQIKSETPVRKELNSGNVGNVRKSEEGCQRLQQNIYQLVNYR